LKSLSSSTMHRLLRKRNQFTIRYMHNAPLYEPGHRQTWLNRNGNQV
jgi:hypothetical protein